MTLTIPAWLLCVAGVAGAGALLVGLAVLILFACMGFVFYKAFSRGIFR